MVQINYDPNRNIGADCIYVFRFSGNGIHRGTRCCSASQVQVQRRGSLVRRQICAPTLLVSLRSFLPPLDAVCLFFFFLHYILFNFFWVMIITLSLLHTRRTHIVTWTEIVFFKNVISVKIMKSCFQNAISKGVVIVYMLTTVCTLSHGLKSCFFKTSSLLHTLIEYTLPCGLKSCF